MKKPSKEIQYTLFELNDAVNQAEAFIGLLMDYIVRFDSGESHIFKDGSACGLQQIEWNTVGRLKKASDATQNEVATLRGIDRLLRPKAAR
jgi:hypothetical protein